MRYQKRFDRSNQMEPFRLLKLALSEYIEIIKTKLLSEKIQIKWYVSTNINFHKATDETIITDPSIVFRTEVFRSLNTNDLDDMIDASYEQLVDAIESYVENGSGWIFDHIVNIDLGKNII